MEEQDYERLTDEVLKRHPGPVEKSDLLVVATAVPETRGDLADRRPDVVRGHETGRDRMLTFADRDRLAGLVDEDGGGGDEIGIELLLIARIGAHGIDVGAGADPLSLDDRLP